MDDSNSTTTKLLTLLNVSATKLGKRKWLDVVEPTVKLNNRKSVRLTEATEETVVEAQAVVPDEPENLDDCKNDPYEEHFGCSVSLLTDTSRAAVDERNWSCRKTKKGSLGLAHELVPSGSTSPSPVTGTHGILPSLWKPFQVRQTKESPERVQLQNDLLSSLSSGQDLYQTSSTWETKTVFRDTTALHALNHVNKKRRHVLKNNERLAHASKANADPPQDVQDQGFTRPSVLILLPFRSSALAWFQALTSHTPPPAFQIENQSRFLAEYGLPPGAVDKLASAEPGVYPPDHVETFKGNMDDNFRVGIKLTRKSVKMFSDFYSCDIIIASPLGLLQSIQKEKNHDYLSSIEILVMDQIDALTMQNWKHVKTILHRLNEMPKESRDADFSRIKPWYLDGHAAYLRQSILFTAYETPETRALYNANLKNVAGKIRLERRWAPVQVPEGVEQNFVRFDCSSANDEADKRFTYFTTQLLPLVLKSAVQSTNTVVFIPSSFDFIRVHNYFRKQTGISFAVLSEYSTNQDISRARQAFFKGQKAFLLVSERFHFYKRYKLRGIRNLIFYGPPDHSQFYAELLSYPFLDADVESTDVTCKVLYSKYDWFKLERVAGTEDAAALIKSI
ncbi:digestive organ expansion factor [Mycena floridula]|nr:digestive organ expansion factor [Mycena floridula]